MRYLRIFGLVLNIAALTLTGLLFLGSLKTTEFKWSNVILVLCVATAPLLNLRKFHSLSSFDKHDPLLINALSSIANLCLAFSGLTLFLFNTITSTPVITSLGLRIGLIVYFLAGCIGLVSCFGFQYPKTKNLSRSGSGQETAQTPPPAFDPSLYPVTYGSSIGAGVALILAMMGSFFLAILGRTHLSLNSPSWMWIYALAMLGLVILIALDSICARITLYADHIERTTWFGKKTMQRDDIEGLRLMGRYNIPSLIYKDNADYPFQLPTGIKKDAAWNAWMASVPDLDALDEKKILSDAADYPSLGVTADEREHRWSITNKLASICQGATFIAMLLAFVPHLAPFAAAVLIVTPWIALANMKFYGVAFNSAQKNPVVGNSITLITAGMGLGIFGAIYPLSSALSLATPFFFPRGAAHILYLMAGPACGLILFVPTMLIVFSTSQWKDNGARIGWGLLIVPFLALFDWGYGVGTALEINTVIDQSKPVLYTAKVDSSPIVRPTTVSFQMSPWGSYQNEHIEVPRSVFGQIALNDIVCVSLHIGLLGVPWYTAAPAKAGSITGQTSCL